jgi:hypothetical protein
MARKPIREDTNPDFLRALQERQKQNQALGEEIIRNLKLENVEREHRQAEWQKVKRAALRFPSLACTQDRRSHGLRKSADPGGCRVDMPVLLSCQHHRRLGAVRVFLPSSNVDRRSLFLMEIKNNGSDRAVFRKENVGLDLRRRHASTIVMFGFGSKRTFARVQTISALPPRADIILRRGGSRRTSPRCRS